jgi:phosphopantothenoylcysteine decarboxylase/phosphopantothenate--cysteine ligase
MKLLVTAGPTREPIDPVRFLSNRSSGKMGYAVAREGRRRGHEVTLVSGPVCLRAPRGVRVLRVTTAEEMLAAVRGHLSWCDALVMAAAVADWRPARPAPRKLKKAKALPRIELEPCPDILSVARARKGKRIFVGFAAETGDPVAEAARKLRDKGLDLVVANDVLAPGAGFEVDTNRVSFVTSSGVRALPLMAKSKVARRLIEWIEAAARDGTRTRPSP